MQNILVVEDDTDIQELLQTYLENSGYSVMIAGDGAKALDLFYNLKFHLILLDIMLPKINGYGVCEVIRSKSDVPIIMLTALDSEKEQIKGYGFHIDDYVTKPFSMSVLLCKIEAIFRRFHSPESKHQINYKNLKIDLDAYKLYIDDTYIDLTKKEFNLIKILLQNQGKVLSRQTLLNHIWSYDFYGDERIVDTHIKNIRKKLNFDYIETVRGVGYRIDKED